MNIFAFTEFAATPGYVSITSNAAYWHERAMKAEARIKPLEETVAAQYAHNVVLEVRLQKIMARCADLLDEDQFNELDAMTRTTVTVTGEP